MHLKYLARNDTRFCKFLADVYNDIYSRKEAISEVPELYEFRPIFIPKDETDFRPISVEETLLTVFHRILKNELTPLIELNNS